MWVSSVLVLCLACLSQSDAAISAQCNRDILDYQIGWQSLQFWALSMLDSSSKFPADGLMQGTFVLQMGNYDECLRVVGPKDADGDVRFRGKYCHVQLGFTISKNSTNPKSALIFKQMQIGYENLKKASNGLEIPGRTGAVSYTLEREERDDIYIPAQWAVCAPSSCGAEGVKKVADYNIGLVFNALMGLQVSTKVLESTCHYEGDGKKDLSAGSWAFIIVCVCITTVAAFSAVVEYFWPNDKELHVAVRAFSLSSNLRDLFKLPTKSFPGQLTCLNGIRVISTWWVILLHCYMANVVSPHLNAAMALEKYPHQWTAAPLLSGGLSVDTFFFLSGLLTAYIPLLDQKRGKSFNIIKYYIFRYLRITLPLAMVVFYLATIHDLTGTSPLWNVWITPQTDKCEKNWWATLLYIVNYYKPVETTCVNQAWYLMVDMQLALLAPIIIYPLLRWPKIGLAMICALTLGSVATAFALTYVHKFPWTIVFLVPVESTGNFMMEIYANTPVRATPYLMGMALAYILANKITFKMPNWMVVVEWILNTVLCLALVYLMAIPYAEGYKYERLAAAFYASLHRVGWSIGVGWVIWACVNGYAGPVNDLLSWKYFSPLSKLSFCAYLVHMDLMNYHWTLLRTHSYFSHFEMVFEYFGNLIMMIPLTLFLYLAVDAPTQVLLRAAVGKANRLTQKEDEKEIAQDKESIVEKTEHLEELNEDKKSEELSEIKSD